MGSRRPPQDFDDRKSVVSSYYGGRQSQDILASNPSPTEHLPMSQVRQRGDPNDYSPRNDSYTNLPLARDAPRGSFSAGYNRDSFAHSGRSGPVKGAYDDEDDGKGGGWDVYADFNNAGPRYSQNILMGNSDGYRALKQPESPSVKPASTAYTPTAELVTVPALGAEWTQDELRDMTKSGKSELKAMDRKRKWREWNRDQRGIGGWKWGYRKPLVWIIFFLVIAIGLMLVFLVPRVPSFAFNDDSPLNANGGTPLFQRLPANFTYDAVLDLQVDTHSSFIPLHFSYLKAEIYSSETSALVATGNLGKWTFKAKTYTPILLPVTFSYEAANTSDTTWTLMYDACKNRSQFTGNKRPGLNLRLILKMKIIGLIPEHSAATTILNAGCPIELSNSSG